VKLISQQHHYYHLETGRDKFLHLLQKREQNHKNVISGCWTWQNQFYLLRQIVQKVFGQKFICSVWLCGLAIATADTVWIDKIDFSITIIINTIFWIFLSKDQNSKIMQKKEVKELISS
jgi:hypothetical protein